MNSPFTIRRQPPLKLWIASLVLCSLLLSDSALGASKGKGSGGTGKSSGSGVAKVSSGGDDDEDAPSFGIRDIPIWGWIIVSIGGITLTCSFISCCCWCYNKRKQNDTASMDSILAGQTQPGSTPTSHSICPLCQKNVKLESWQSGKHRKKCAQKRKYKALLEGMEQPSGSLRCPHCKHRLRQWPARRGAPFVCDSTQCAIIGRVQSNGHNRFNCFLCNYDLCDSCARRKHRDTSTSRHVRTASSKSNRSTMTTHRNSTVTAEGGELLTPPSFDVEAQRRRDRSPSTKEEIVLPSYDQVLEKERSSSR